MTYIIYDTKERTNIGKTHSTRKAANKITDKKNKQYGATKYTVRML